MSGRCYPEWSKQGPIFVKLTVQMGKRLITNKKISKSEENNKENKKGDIIKGDWADPSEKEAFITVKSYIIKVSQGSGNKRLRQRLSGVTARRQHGDRQV